MGALAGDPCPMSSQNDVAHAVTIEGAFEISATEVTQAEYVAAIGLPDPWANGCDDCPVAMLSWHDAAAVCNAYSELAALPSCYVCSDDACEPTGSPYACEGYRLPTEAEWEYAARAGTTTGVHFGQIEICSSADPLLDTLGWYLYDSDGGTHPVAQKLPNAWGLYDTIGNVWEWAHDGYVTDLSSLPAVDPIGESDDDLHAIRGGSYNCTPGEVRLAHRSALPSTTTGLNVGVRCVRSLEP